jgi:hypothetical protein
MLRELRERRDRAFDRHEAALSAYPNREGDAFTRELQAVVDELVAVTRAADDPSADPVEVAKAYRWLGDAYFDLGRGANADALKRGAWAYGRSGELLADADAPLEQAKLDFNYGNTLRGLSGGEDAGLLEAAQARYERAVKVFQALHFPDWQATVEQQLRSIDPQLRLARKSSEMSRGHKRLEALQQQLKGAGPADRERIARELNDLMKRPGRGDPASAVTEALAAIREQFEQHPERRRSGDAENLTALEKRMQSLAKLIKGKGSVEQSAPAAPAAPEQTILRALTERLQGEVADRRVSSDKAAKLGGLLEKFGAALSQGGGDLDSLAGKVDRMRELTRQATDEALRPSWRTPEPEPGRRAHRLTAIFASLNRYLLSEAGRTMLPTQEAAACTDLLTRSFELETGVREAASDDDRVRVMEDDVWRLALAVQEHARRHHLMLARPDFASVRVHAAAKSLFVSGDERLQEVAERLVQRDGLQLLGEAGRGDLAQDRWNQLCAASLAAFDVSISAGPGQAQVCYELGLALALGKPSIVVARRGQSLPFDVNLKPLKLTGAPEQDSNRLADAIEHALSTIVWGGSGGAIGDMAHDALNWLRRRYGDRLSDGSLRIAFEMAEQQQDDAVGFRRSLERLFGVLGADAPAVLLSAWPPAYPHEEQLPRCFHVMPFRPKWSRPTRDLAERICERRRWGYTRGDEAKAQRIIYGIWSEIASATAALVDITGHNPNVALELGLVHALGRPYRVLAQGEPEQHRFPSLEKVQIHAYGDGPDFPGFEEALEGLLASKRS